MIVYIFEIVKSGYIYSQIWANDHLFLTTTILWFHLEILQHKWPLNNDHLSTTATIFGSQGWSLWIVLSVLRSTPHTFISQVGNHWSNDYKNSRTSSQDARWKVFPNTFQDKFLCPMPVHLFRRPKKSFFSIKNYYFLATTNYWFFPFLTAATLY